MENHCLSSMRMDDLVVLTSNMMGLSTDIKAPAPDAPKETISDLFMTQTIPTKQAEPQKEAPGAEKK